MCDPACVRSFVRSQCYPMHESSLKPVDNMVDLGGLNVRT